MRDAGSVSRDQEFQRAASLRRRCIGCRRRSLMHFGVADEDIA